MITSEKIEREIKIETTLTSIATKLNDLITTYTDIISGQEQELNDLYEALEKKEDHIRNLEGTINDLKDEVYRMEEAAGVYPAWTRR